MLFDGNKTMGSKAVTAIGITSLIHQIAIQHITPKSLKPSLDISVGGSSIKKHR